MVNLGAQAAASQIGTVLTNREKLSIAARDSFDYPLVALSAAPIPSVEIPVEVKVVMAQIQATRERLQKIFHWAATGVIRPQISSRFLLQEGSKAYALSEAGHARGKIVMTL